MLTDRRNNMLVHHKRPLLALAALAVVVGSACQENPDHRLIGAWSTDRTATHIPELPSRDVDRKLKRSIYAAQLKLSSDHTYVLSGFGQGSLIGRWQYQNSKLKLSDENGFKLGFSDPLALAHEFTVSPDFSRISVKVPTPVGDLTIVFDKTA